VLREGGFLENDRPTELGLLAEALFGESALLVADEVQAGIARTGTWFASEHDGLVPDMIVTAKGQSAMLDFGQALAMKQTTFTFPPAERLTSGFSARLLIRLTVSQAFL